ncbi:armadillo-type protein [Melanogaster broomeanus]|nr:armadillo-type protein [Melanogaster broomeanus]
MQPTANQQSFLPFADDYSPPRSRTTAGSIWAPQPQPLESTWPNSINTLSRDAEKVALRSQKGLQSFSRTFGGEDVFGPLGVGAPRKTDVGAIGDGRKTQSPEFEDKHVEQLLRALNLNSPAPCTQQPLRPPNGEATNLSGSPDLSPSSTTSALLTPTDLSPAKSFDLRITPPYEFDVSSVPSGVSSSPLLFDPCSPFKTRDFMSAANISSRFPGPPASCVMPSNNFPFFEQYSDGPSPVLGTQPLYDSAFPQLARRPELHNVPSMIWRQQQQQQLSAPAELPRAEKKPTNDFSSGLANEGPSPHLSFSSRQGSGAHSHEASIFLQQKLKVADLEERHKIVDAICARGFEMMSHRGRVVELATNCYGCHVLQKALDCEEDIRLLIVSELLLGDPALTLVNKHASHVWSKIMELTWTPPAPPIFAYVNKSLKGKWASLACHETGSLVVQHAFENLEDSAKDGIIDELLNQGSVVFNEIAKNQWGSYCIQHILEHGSAKHRQMCHDHLIADLLDYATSEQGFKSVTKAFKEIGPETLGRIVNRLCEPAKGGRRAMIVDLALSVTGSQLIASVLPQADKDQRAMLYDCIKGHIVTLRGCKTGSKVIWLL